MPDHHHQSLCCNESPHTWLVCLICFLAHYLCLGFSYSLGIYYVIFLEAFGHDPGVTAWVPALNYGMLCFAGPLTSVVIERVGYRVTLFAGGIIAGIGIFTSAFASNIWILMVSFGLITGFGFGLVHAAALIIIGVKFTTCRSIAFGISLSGAGMGNMFQPLVNVSLIDYYGWRSALLLIAGTVLNVCVLAMLIRPTPESKTSRKHHDECIEYSNQPTDKLKIYEIDRHKKLAHKCPYGLDLFVSPGFIIIFLSTLCCNIGIICFTTHIAAYAASVGHPHVKSAILISVFGIGSLFGRLLAGVAAQFMFHPTTVKIVTLLMDGVSCLVVGCTSSYPALVAASLTCGIGMGGWGTSVANVTLHVVGAAGYSMGFGWIILAMGSGLIGGPLAGFVYDQTAWYPSSFFLAAACFLVAMLLVLPVRFIYHLPHDAHQGELHSPLPEKVINDEEDNC